MNISAQQFQNDLQQCKQLMLREHFADALVLARKLFEQDSDNLLLHLLMATLYARNNQLQKAMSHYALLCQFDDSFKEHHVAELARGYHRKGHTDLAAILAQAGAFRLNSKALYQMAIDYYMQSGNEDQAKKMQPDLAAAQ